MGQEGGQAVSNLIPEQKSGSSLGKDLAPYRIGNTATLKIGQKCAKTTQRIGIWAYFGRIFDQNLLVGPFSYSVGGQFFSKLKSG